MNTTKITQETEVSTTELACVLGVTGRRIRQLAEDGQIDKISQGKFNLCDCVQRYLSFLEKPELDEEETKYEKARRAADAQLKASKAALSKMEVAELQGRMHRSEDVAAMTEDLIYSIRGMLLALPGRLADDVHSAETVAEAEAIIRKEIYAVMEAISRYQYDPRKYEERVRERRSWKGSFGGEDDDD